MTPPAHAKHQRDVFHAWMLDGIEFSKDWDMPVRRSEEARPRALVAFSTAMHPNFDDYSCFVHFYEDDFRFERLWNDPQRCLPKLARFAGVIMPNFSTAVDFPIPLKMWNAYRNQLLGAWMQKQGLVVLPNARAQLGCPWLLEGLPRHSTIAICGRAQIKDVDERRRFVRDLRTTIDELEPSCVVYYGADTHGVLEYPRLLGIPIQVFSGADRWGSSVVANG